jgi:hypothetical protein
VIPLAAVALALATPGLADGQGFRRAEPEGLEKMARNSTIIIEGKRYLWQDILKLRREQKLAEAKVKQPTLFPLIEDARPASQRTAAGRYTEPTLFTPSDARANPVRPDPA